MSKLMEAILRSDVTAMKQVIASGDNLSELDGGMTPLLWAVFWGDIDAVRHAAPRLRRPGSWVPSQYQSLE